MKRLFFLAGIGLFSAAAAPARTVPLGREVHLRLPGPVHSVHVFRARDDASRDLLICHLSEEPSPGRMMTLFRGRENGPDTAGVTFALHPDDILFDLTDLDGNGNAECVFLRADGIYRRSLSGPDEDASCLIRTPSAFTASDPARIRRFPLALDLDGDGLPEICVPESGRLAAYRLRDGNYALAASFEIRPAWRIQESGRTRVTLDFPAYRLLDFDGDGKLDLLAVFDDRVDVFFLRDFPDAPADPPASPDLRIDLGVHRMPLTGLETLAPVSSRIEALDLNGDGVADFIVALAARAGFVGSLSQIHIHLNRRGRISPLPDRVLTADNFLGEYLAADFNGNGLTDLALFNFRPGYGAAARFILTRRLSHTHDFYLMRPDGSYPGKPDFRWTATRKPRVSDPGSAIFAACYAADFDGDGLTDLLTPEDENHWRVFPGNSAGNFDKSRKITVNAPPTRSLLIADLDGDGAADVLFFYPGDPERNRQVRILLGTPSPGLKAETQ
ncbi:MAG TPA: VCBS repeat-containing protein [bacterium]|nr:VCBS repeat-containing protein [bacterium]